MKIPGRALPPLNALRAFESSARLMSFTRAAEELHVTQGAVSQQVKLLEEYLDTPLFFRQHRKLELTDAGKAYLPVLTQVFSSLQTSTNELFACGVQSRLTIKCGTSFSQHWLMPRIADFHKKHPEIQIRLTSSVWPAPEGMVDEVDLEISNGQGNWVNGITEKLTDEYWLVVASPAFLEKNPVPENVEAILALPLLSTLGDRENWQVWFRRQGVTHAMPQPVLESDTSTMAIEAAKHHLGLFLGRSFNLQASLQNGSLIQAHPFTLKSSGSHYLILPNQHLPLKTKIFCQWLREQMK